VAELKKLIAMTPDHWLGHFELSGVYARGSRLDEARAEGEKAVDLSGGAPIAITRLACVCHALGDTGRGNDLLDRLKTRSLDTYVSPSFFAWVHLARGEPESALRMLEEALRIKDPWLCFTRLYCRPFFPSDSRVDALLKEVGW
jgi:tetratricopeptide (TPR) repeat protein